MGRLFCVEVFNLLGSFNVELVKKFWLIFWLIFILITTNPKNRRKILRISLDMERALNPNHIPNSPPKLQTNPIKVISNEWRTTMSGKKLC